MPRLNGPLSAAENPLMRTLPDARLPRPYTGLAALAILAWSLSGCGGSGTGPVATIQPAGAEPPQAGVRLKGVSLSPLTFQGPDFNEFFALAGQSGQIVEWVGDWDELGPASDGPEVLAGLRERFKYQPVFVAAIYEQSKGLLLRPLDAANLQSYKTAAVEFARKYRPGYLGLGVEVNIMWEKAPAEFEKFVDLYAETYDAVKAVSPQTRVFTVFQLERLKGLQGGLFGGRNDTSLAQWQLLERFAKADLVGFSTYPGLVFKDPLDLPADYYSEITRRTTKPVIFTEIGWSSQTPAAGWETDEAEQEAFVRRFFQLTAEMPVDAAIWSFLFDQPLGPPFAGMGLISRDGRKRPVFDAWSAAP